MRSGLALPAALALVLFGCDSRDTPQVVTFQGIDVEAVGGTELRVEGNRLVVDGVDAEGDGIGLWENYDRVDLKVAPIQLPTGGRFGTSVRDADDRFIAGIESQDRGDQTHDIVFEVADRLGVQTVTLQYLLNEDVIAEIPNVRIGGSSLKLRAEASAGTGDGRNGSTRVVRVGGRYVVGQDYSNASEGARPVKGPGGGCEFALVTLPVSTGEASEVCVDLVQVVIETDALPREIRGVAVTGQSLGRFEITKVDVEGG